MGFMPGIISRDRLFKRFDFLLNAHPAEVLEALKEPQRTISVLETAIEVHRRLNPSEPANPDDATAVQCTHRFWAGKAEDYFDIDPSIYTATARKKIAAAAYIRALELGGGTKQIRSHYCCVGSHFEAAVLAGEPADATINVVLITGRLKDGLVIPSDVLFDEHESVWIATTSQRIDETLARGRVKAPKVDNVFGPDTDVVYANPERSIGVVRPRRWSNLPA